MEIAGVKIGIVEIAIALFITGAAYYLSGYARDFGQYSYLGVFIITLVSSATILLPVPGWAVVIGLSHTLDPILLGIAAGLGSGIGEITGYMLGAGGAEIAFSGVETKKGASPSRQSNLKADKKEGKRPHQDKIMDFVVKHEDLGIFFLAAVPNPLFDIAGIAAGAIRMPWYRFLVACTLGKIVRFVVFLLLLGRLTQWLF